jgi:hypothetical protein
MWNEINKRKNVKKKWIPNITLADVLYTIYTFCMFVLYKTYADVNLQLHLYWWGMLYNTLITIKPKVKLGALKTYVLKTLV